MSEGAQAPGASQATTLQQPAPVQQAIGVQQAIRLLDHVPVSPRIVRVGIARAAGLRLARDVIADRNYPPFRKSLMDGYAVRRSDVAQTPTNLHVIGEIAAGHAPAQPLQPGEAMAIMTGAPLPDGADGVVPVEDVEARVPVGGTVHVLRAAAPQRFVAAPGSDCPAGRIVLKAGDLLGPAQVAVAASVGAAELSCFARPRVAVLGTGDELVPVHQDPGPWQIRDSNTPMLVALLQRLGCEVADVATACDEPNELRVALRHGLAHDALFVTGGMSMGEYDFIPRLLLELNVEMKITTLRMKPGKPFVFGVAGESVTAIRESAAIGETPALRDSDARGEDAAASSMNGHTGARAASELAQSRFVFGLPGNPVSAFVCTIRLASRLLDRMGGGAPVERWVSGRLTEGLPANGPREFYQPAIRSMTAGQHSAKSEFASVTPLAWKGSADLFTLAAANALLVRAENEPAVPKGTLVRVLEI